MNTADARGGGRVLPSRLTFSIVVPTFRRPDALDETLSHVLALDFPATGYEVVVVDDAADPRTAPVVEAHRRAGPAVHLLSQRGLGAAAARNRGAQRAAGELLLFCDDDMLLAADHLSICLEDLRREPAAVVGGWWEFAPALARELQETPFGRYRLALERRYREEAVARALPRGPHLAEVELLAAGNVALRRADFVRLGGFDESFPFAGAEDQDFSIRAREAGLSLLIDDRLQPRHNDRLLDLGDYCAREERSAATMTVMAKRRPDLYAGSAYVRENEPARRGDPVRIAAKKALKRLLSWSGPLRVLHGLSVQLDRLALPDAARAPLYRWLLGLHLFRGFRRAW